MFVKIEDGKVKVASELPRVAVIGDNRVYNPTAEMLGFEVMEQPEEKEGKYWTLEVVRNKVKVVYHEDVEE